MYACSQLRTLQRVEVGNVLLCTHAHINSITLNSVAPRTTYVTSSWYTEYKLIKPGKPLPSLLEQYVPEISPKLIQNFATSGGYFTLPTPFSTVRDLQLYDADFEITPFTEVEALIDKLAQRERVQIVCQGFVQGIHLRPNKRKHNEDNMDPSLPEFADKLPISYKYNNSSIVQEELPEGSLTISLDLISINRDITLTPLILPNSGEFQAGKNLHHRDSLSLWTWRTFLTLFQPFLPKNTFKPELPVDRILLQQVKKFVA
ncbi:hypothetical protein K7432_014851 [Basidiobolus ranarum]|uniref:Uncharacterized protein n=1 Tax=Basidiobolus ranarum TaxID=34480 RepID=A0ABR2WGY4_9FUNG